MNNFGGSCNAAGLIKIADIDQKTRDRNVSKDSYKILYLSLCYTSITYQIRFQT